MKRKTLLSITRQEPPERLHSIDEAADILGLSHHTVRNWVRDRKIEVNKQGSRSLISSNEIERLIREGRRPAIAA